MKPTATGQLQFATTEVKQPGAIEVPGKIDGPFLIASPCHPDSKGVEVRAHERWHKIEVRCVVCMQLIMEIPIAARISPRS